MDIHYLALAAAHHVNPNVLSQKRECEESLVLWGSCQSIGNIRLLCQQDPESHANQHLQRVKPLPNTNMQH